LKYLSINTVVVSTWIMQKCPVYDCRVELDGRCSIPKLFRAQIPSIHSQCYEEEMYFHDTTLLGYLPILIVMALH